MKAIEDNRAYLEPEEIRNYEAQAREMQHGMDQVMQKMVQAGIYQTRKSRTGFNPK